MITKKNLVALVVAGTLGGCQLLGHEEAPSKQIVSEWANRPVVDTLEVIPDESPKMEVASVEPEVSPDKSWFSFGFGSDFEEGEDEYGLELASGLVEPGIANSTEEQFEGSEPGHLANDKVTDKTIFFTPDKDEIEHVFFNAESDLKPQHSYIAQTSSYLLDESESFVFMAYEGEKYRSALSRWLSDQGYGVVGWYLDDLQQMMIDVPLKENIHIVSTLDDVVSELFIKLKAEDVYRSGELVSKKEQELAFIELRLNAESSEAVVTSKKMPTTIFHVMPGSLKDNFVRLGEHYGWNVSPDFYLASDYSVKFGYPIVSEEGNVKVGLEKLLAPFSSLRGALVPSVREIYVVQEER